MRLSLFIALFILTVSSSAAKLNGPVKAIYIDYQGFNWGNPTAVIKEVVDSGFNMIILAFYLNKGPADMAQAWAAAPNSQKISAIDYAHSKGAVVMVSAGGATDTPYSATGSDYGTRAAQFAQKHFLDGVDFDMENFEPGLKAAGKTSEQTIQWLADASNAARKVLGDKAVITHAPQAPYFGRIGGGAGSNPWTHTSGGYSAVYKKAPTIDYFLVQFYNQGATCYTNYRGIFENSSDCPPFPGTSVKEIAAYGIPLDKIVVGKPVRQNDGSNGQLAASTFNTIVKQAKNTMGWNTGVMGWVWSNKAESGKWIQTIYPASQVAATTTAATKPVAKPATTTVAAKPVAKPATTTAAAKPTAAKPTAAPAAAAKPVTVAAKPQATSSLRKAQP